MATKAKQKKRKGGWRKPNVQTMTTTLRVHASLLSRADQLAVGADLPRAAVLRMALEAGMEVLAVRLAGGAP